MVKSAALGPAARRWWQRARRRVGASGMFGVAFLGLALLLLAATPILRNAVETTRGALERREQALRRAPIPAAPALTAQEQAEQFVNELPSFERNAADVRAVFAGAARARVALIKGDYAIKADAGSPFIAYTVTLPVHEPYGALKEFTAEVLRTLPHAALDELRMARTDANGEVLDATVRFTLVYRRP